MSGNGSFTYRRFLLTVGVDPYFDGGQDLFSGECRQEGAGMDLGRVFDIIRSDYDQATQEGGKLAGLTPEQVAARWNDIAVWEGNRVVAVIRPSVDGRLVMTRLDQPAGCLAG